MVLRPIMVQPRAGSHSAASSRPDPKLRAWVGVVSRAHVQRGVAGGFAQVCHGKRAPLARMGSGDWFVYYSPTTEFKGGLPLRAFTAIGRIRTDVTYAFDMGEGFVPYRRDIAYEGVLREVPVQELSRELRFIRENPNWGMLARRGLFEIPLEDMRAIALALLGPAHPALGTLRAK
ncbi:MAG TPA: EVE domain-containing protein [Polyangiaceae bacterium]|nr:EVE domain-containing protein [Polyangiaceae bacterium]